MAAQGRVLDATQIVLELTAADSTVVRVGIDVPLDIALGVAAIMDRAHPDLSVVLVASPNEDVWRLTAGRCPRRHRAGSSRR